MSTNPIIKGFSPDPCICKANGKYYLATSTFEWYPGVEIWESTNLVDWDLVKRPLVHEKHMNLTGIPDSGGIWAPALSYHDGKFWLFYTICKQIDGVFKDVENYITTCEKINGEWDSPIYIHSSGFDPSLFHDGDRKYVLNPQWDYRSTNGKVRFKGIELREFSYEKSKFVGESHTIFTGTATGGAEGPNIIKKNGYYYLICAEGGTGRHHSIVVARSRQLTGPYELSPYGTLITSFHDMGNPLQKAGHGNIIQSYEGRWYLVHLTSRYISEQSRVCQLGRESAIQEIIWQDGWPRLKGTDYSPLVNIESLPARKKNSEYFTTSFNNGVLDKEWFMLRRPIGERIKLNEGFLRMYGGDSLSSLFNQSLLARKWKSFDFNTETTFRFNPNNYQELSGIVCYYNTKNWLFLYVSRDEISHQRVVNLLLNKNGSISEPLSGLYGYLPNDCEKIKLKFSVENAQIQCYYSHDNEPEHSIGQIIDGTFLSDEKVDGWAYTGAMVGITAIDLKEKISYTDFLHFSYKDK
ncbi:hypothetical protein BKP56_05135 [Marinilactibacillus sp. 15R]|uniref:glycoside hydrolase family 43 protein n=1 Tax=Marinilactibacillus sp. 15R TaxID=1911586 RepID=UPI00090BB7AD|nr:glycoside hydrolase family 43 protein [Marinilactibacillus sp. 15R]API88708.1 hypothetical protein BKP56_05135 [Marinilactibacillus sp. 15R]